MSSWAEREELRLRESGGLAEEHRAPGDGDRTEGQGWRLSAFLLKGRRKGKNEFGTESLGSAEKYS